jgi:hypothetical protein
MFRFRLRQPPLIWQGSIQLDHADACELASAQQFRQKNLLNYNALTRSRDRVLRHCGSRSGARRCIHAFPPEKSSRHRRNAGGEAESDG